MDNVAHDRPNPKSTRNRTNAGPMRRRRADRSAGSSNEGSDTNHGHLAWRNIKLKWPYTLYTLIIVLLGSTFLVLLSRNNTQVMKEVVPQNTPAFVVVSLPGKGMGMIASRDIAAGELLIREKPLFIVPSTTDNSPENLIFTRISGLSDDERAAFFNLSYVVPGFDTSEVQLSEKQVALAIFQTNAIAAGGGVGIFPTVARLNHGCSSAFNAIYSWRSSEGVLVVHALKYIQRGTELLTTYTDTKKRRAERRSYLKESYGFECSCSVCSLSGANSLESDERLMKMSALYTKLASWSSTFDGKAAVKVAREIWKIGDAEGYLSERGQLAADVVHVAAAHSDKPTASLWAKLAVEWFTRELGSDSDQVRLMQKYARNPQSHSAWATQQTMSVG